MTIRLVQPATKNYGPTFVQIRSVFYNNRFRDKTKCRQPLIFLKNLQEATGKKGQLAKMTGIIFGRTPTSGRVL